MPLRHSFAHELKELEYQLKRMQLDQLKRHNEQREGHIARKQEEIRVLRRLIARGLDPGARIV